MESAGTPPTSCVGKWLWYCLANIQAKFDQLLDYYSSWPISVQYACELLAATDELHLSHPVQPRAARTAPANAQS